MLNPSHSPRLIAWTSKIRVRRSRTEEHWYILIFREVCQVVLEVVIPVGELPILETAKNVHPLRELIVKSDTEDILHGFYG